MSTNPLNFECVVSVEEKEMDDETEKSPEPWPEETADSDAEYDLEDAFIDNQDYSNPQEEADHICQCTHPSHLIRDSLGTLWELDEPPSEDPSSAESLSDDEDSLDN